MNLTLLSPEEHARVWSMIGVQAHATDVKGLVRVHPETLPRFAKVVETMLAQTAVGPFYTVGTVRERGTVSVGLFHRGGVA